MSNDFLNLAATNVKAAVQQMKQIEEEEAALKRGRIDDSTIEIAKKFMEKRKLTTKDFAEDLGVSRPLMSQYLNKKYTSDTTAIEKKILDHLKSEDFIGEKKGFKRELQKLNFLPSVDALNILGICSKCQEQGGLGVIIGQSGFGKTYTLKKFAEKDRVAYVECDDGMNIKDMVDSIEKALGLPYLCASIWNRSDNIKEFFKVNSGYILIMDEADKLINKTTQRKAEILRAIFDQSNVGIVLAGEPALEGQIKGYIPRLANRVDFFYKLEGISKKEVSDYLGDIKLTDEAFEEMYKRAINNYTGCFRLLNRTVKNILRIINSGDDPDAVVTLDIIRQASSMMMI